MSPKESGRRTDRSVGPFFWREKSSRSSLSFFFPRGLIDWWLDRGVPTYTAFLLSTRSSGNNVHTAFSTIYTYIPPSLLSIYAILRYNNLRYNNIRDMRTPPQPRAVSKRPKEKSTINLIDQNQLRGVMIVIGGRTASNQKRCNRERVFITFVYESSLDSYTVPRYLRLVNLPPPGMF